MYCRLRWVMALVIVVALSVVVLELDVMSHATAFFGATSVVEDGVSPATAGGSNAGSGAGNRASATPPPTSARNPDAPLWKPAPAAEPWAGGGSDPFYVTPWRDLSWLRDVALQLPLVNCTTLDVAPADHTEELAEALKEAQQMSDFNLQLQQLFCHAQWQNHVLAYASSEDLVAGKWPVVVWEPNRGLADALGWITRDFQIAFRMRALFFVADVSQWWHTGGNEANEQPPLQAPMNWLWHEHSHRFNCSYGVEFEKMRGDAIRFFSFVAWASKATNFVPSNVIQWGWDAYKGPWSQPPVKLSPMGFSAPAILYVYQPSAAIASLGRRYLANRSSYVAVGIHVRSLFVGMNKGNVSQWKHCWENFRDVHRDIPPGTPVKAWIAADEGHVIDFLTRAIGKESTFHQNGKRCHTYDSASSVACKRAAFVDFFMLQRCDYFWGTVQSTWTDRLVPAMGLPGERWLKLGSPSVPQWCEPKPRVTASPITPTPTVSPTHSAG